MVGMILKTRRIAENENRNRAAISCSPLLKKCHCFPTSPSEGNLSHQLL